MKETRARRRVLIVDDEAANVHALAHALSDECALIFATKGECALELAATGNVELVLLDEDETRGFDLGGVDYIVSVGSISLVPENVPMGAASFLAEADRLLYEAKGRGRARAMHLDDTTGIRTEIEEPPVDAVPG